MLRSIPANLHIHHEALDWAVRIFDCKLSGIICYIFGISDFWVISYCREVFRSARGTLHSVCSRPFAMDVSVFTYCLASCPSDVFSYLGCFFLFGRGIDEKSYTERFFFLAAMYSYQAQRLQVPLLIGGMFFLRIRGVHIRWARKFFLTLFLFGLPLLYEVVWGDSLRRVEDVNIFSKQYLDSIIPLPYFPLRLLLAAFVFLSNFLHHFSLQFLFLSGDSNPRHSTQLVGELSWVDLLAMLTCALFVVQRKGNLAGLFADDRNLLTLIALGIGSGVVPAALTFEGIPHAIRSIGASVFYPLFTGLVILRCSSKYRFYPLVTLISGLIFCLFYFYGFFWKYPDSALEVFDTQVKTSAQEAARSGDWSEYWKTFSYYPETTHRYYFMTLANDTCSLSIQRVTRLKEPP